MSEQERCCVCDSFTGRAGGTDDSLFLNNSGPYCPHCFDAAEFATKESRKLLTEQDAEKEKLNQKIELLHAKIRGMEKFRNMLRRIIK